MGERRRQWIRGVYGAFLVAAGLVLAGCGGNQSTLAPESGAERRITRLWWIMCIGAAIGFAIVLTLLLLGWFHRRKRGLFGAGDRFATAIVVGLGIPVPIIILVTLFVYSDVFVIKSTAAPATSSTSMTIDVVGHQWFWAARYPGTTAVTANEIHIPVRTRVDIVGTTDDVIHSFWIPQLNRKIDLIPGRTNRILLDADKPGVYRGQCAEFCGLQHANMAAYVFAEPQATFQAWLRNEAKPARPPATAQEKHGHQVFVAQACSGCHAIRGTDAAGKIGPDLTHVGSRTTLAGLTIPNTPDYLARWIENPQQFKEGAKMPSLHLNATDVQAVVAYLESLR
jgi:cytochrome c oxidase subunit II